MNGEVVPKFDVVKAIIIGCGGGEDDLSAFATAWRSIPPGLRRLRITAGAVRAPDEHGREASGEWRDTVREITGPAGADRGAAERSKQAAAGPTWLARDGERVVEVDADGYPGREADPDDGRLQRFWLPACSGTKMARTAYVATWLGSASFGDFDGDVGGFDGGDGEHSRF